MIYIKILLQQVINTQALTQSEAEEVMNGFFAHCDSDKRKWKCPNQGEATKTIHVEQKKEIETGDSSIMHILQWPLQGCPTSSMQPYKFSSASKRKRSTGVSEDPRNFYQTEKGTRRDVAWNGTGRSLNMAINLQCN